MPSLPLDVSQPLTRFHSAAPFTESSMPQEPKTGFFGGGYSVKLASNETGLAKTFSQESILKSDSQPKRLAQRAQGIAKALPLALIVFYKLLKSGLAKLFANDNNASVPNTPSHNALPVSSRKSYVSSINTNNANDLVTGPAKHALHQTQLLVDELEQKESCSLKDAHTLIREGQSPKTIGNMLDKGNLRSPITFLSGIKKDTFLTLLNATSDQQRTVPDELKAKAQCCLNKEFKSDPLTGSTGIPFNDFGTSGNHGAFGKLMATNPEQVERLGNIDVKDFLLQQLKESKTIIDEFINTLQSEQV